MEDVADVKQRWPLQPDAPGDAAQQHDPQLSAVEQDGAQVPPARRRQGATGERAFKHHEPGGDQEDECERAQDSSIDAPRPRNHRKMNNSLRNRPVDRIPRHFNSLAQLLPMDLPQPHFSLSLFC
jgi:hypothetical protein